MDDPIRNMVYVHKVSGIYRLNLSKYLLAVKTLFAKDQTYFSEYLWAAVVSLSYPSSCGLST